MSQRSKLMRSRNGWKCKAGQRGAELRYVRKELGRTKKQRNALKRKLKETRTELRRLKDQNQAPAVQHKVDLVFLVLQLFLVARIGFRAVSRVLGTLAMPLGIKKAPCAQTIINWVQRLSLVRMQSAPMLKGSPLPQAPFSNGLIWMIDLSIALGTGKILTVLALNASHHQFVPTAPGLEHVHCIAVSVAVCWTGETIAAFLKRIIDVMGCPAGYLKDGGADLHKAIRLLDEQTLGSPSIDDISHVIANLLKWWYGDHPMLETFLSACGRVSGKLKQTILACLIPPNTQTKARFMNLHRLVAWANRLLKLSPVGGAKVGSILSKLRSCFDKLPSCRAFIKSFLQDAEPLLECQKILKTKGLSHETLSQCEPFVQAIPSTGLRRSFEKYLQGQIDVAVKLGLDKIGMPISSDPIESLFGLAKQHGVAEIKDADRIAMRLPALCGTPTREEAQQVLKISVAQQNELMGCLSSLAKQRRDVLPNPSRLESLGTGQSDAHVELVPSAKNRPNYPTIIELPITYKETSGPLTNCQTGWG